MTRVHIVQMVVWVACSCASTPARSLSLAAAANSLAEREPIRVEFCKELGYTNTSGINFLQESQSNATENAVFKALLNLHSTGCSELVKSFACSIFVPKSLDRYGAAPPCKSVCDTVSRECYFYLELFSFITFRPLVKLHCQLLKNDGCIDSIYNAESDIYESKLRGVPKRSHLADWFNSAALENIKNMFKS